MDKQITVVGAGGTGCCTAADLTLRGHAVTLADQPGWSDDNLAAIKKRGGVNLAGRDQVGFAELACCTTDFSKAIPSADVIFITALSIRHADIAKEMLPYIRDGQVILISAGNLGSIVFRNEMKAAGCKADIVIGELEGNMFPCRLRANAEGFVGLPFKPKTVAAFPARDNDRLVAAIGEIYEAHAAKNVMETYLNASNLIVHLGGSILNTGLVEQTENFCFYNQGLTPSVITMIEALGAERDAISNLLGCTVRSSVGFMKQLADKEGFPQHDTFRYLEGPLTMADRYIFEDAQTGANFLASLGDMLGSPAPIARAFVTIASALNKTDYAATGNTVEKLGLAGMNTDQLNQYLQDGER